MKFTTILSVLTVVAAVGAARVDTNAARFARGLPPIAPVKRGSSVAGTFGNTIVGGHFLMESPGARRGSPSGTPPAQCKPLLQTCSAHSDCCSDLCILNVRFPLLKFLNSEAPFNSSFAPDYRAEILRCSWVLWVLYHISTHCKFSPDDGYLPLTR